ncbi:hypothetical protein ONZ43_g4810 [Nemania bipapillata]|uniref:Uncharacterized protein n=1 Tax=Nemania bipapillata TaxID=110536 RepID=A0ACC2II47_9PEZI|nr:hypothetical protein ONZ43_g4810 [Nemania bipapillata]
MMHSSSTAIAVVGMACRLPGGCESPKDLWEFIVNGGIASNQPPASRFNLDGHYDGSLKPLTMKTPGGMFMDKVDPADFDAAFFSIDFAGACSMDPQQRLLMEVAFECLESAGIPKEKMSGENIGCIIGASAVDYQDMGCRDPEDRVLSPTLGLHRALLSNRISHFFNIHGPSFTVDTACSSTLTAVDLACLFLRSGQVNGMLVGGANLFLSPERNQDMGAMRIAASATGRCHVFDAKADGYVTAEAINMVYLKRLDCAARDRDPIRAVILGSASNSSGITPGITTPSAEAQAAVIRTSYRNAGIPESDYNQTGFVECHGTGTQAGDPVEISGISLVFGPGRAPDQPLIVGSVKGNIGHSEPAAGITGLLKAVLAIENGLIPGTATFVTPSPAIDFHALKVKASRRCDKWPPYAKRRASINSFGFGGSNAHIVIESPEYLLQGTEPWYKSTYMDVSQTNDNSPDDVAPPNAGQSMVLVVSANDEKALERRVQALSSHAVNPTVHMSLVDVAYTLSERRSRLHYRAYSVQQSLDGLGPASFITGKRPNSGHEIRLGLVFTGQGFQWPMMGKDIIQEFTVARETIIELDKSLGELPEPPNFSLLDRLTANCDPAELRDPALSQPLTVALQLAYLAVLSDWGIFPNSVIGHSSGEIAAAVAAGYLTPSEAIRMAYLRGQAIKLTSTSVCLGMLAVGLTSEATQAYISQIDDSVLEIACYNSPESHTVSGPRWALDRLLEKLQSDGHFARMLQVDTAYHSKHIEPACRLYRTMLDTQHKSESGHRQHDVTMFSTVSGVQAEGPFSSDYWTRNLASPVKFTDAMSQMIAPKTAGANFLIEVGPSNTLAGPISQILKSVARENKAGNEVTASVPYHSVSKRGSGGLYPLYAVAGAVFAAGGSVDFSRVNRYDGQGRTPSVLVDLPNYPWNHTIKYWHESVASRDWRHRPFPRHDLLGSKVLATSWASPVWHNRLRVDRIPWMLDHRVGEQVVFPGSGYVCMAMEAVCQTMSMTEWKDQWPQSFRYMFRDVTFHRALVLEERSETSVVMLTLNKPSAMVGSWYEFKVSSRKDDMEGIWHDHATGLVRLEPESAPTVPATESSVAQLQQPTPTMTWYKYMRAAGLNYGPSFQKHIAIESTLGRRVGRSLVSLQPPDSPWRESSYVIHPACMDGCFQTIVAPLHGGDYTSITAALVPTRIESLVIYGGSRQSVEAISVARSSYTGVGGMDSAKNYSSDCSVYDQKDGSTIMKLSGLRVVEQNPYSRITSNYTYTQLNWDIDISQMTDEVLRHIALKTELDQNTQGKGVAAIIRRLVDLVAFKNPRLSVLEVQMDTNDATSTWLDVERSGDSPDIRTAFSRYVFMSHDAGLIVSARDRYGTPPNVEYKMNNLETSKSIALGSFDLVIIKVGEHQASCMGTSRQILDTTRLNVAEGGLALIVYPHDYKASHVLTINREDNDTNDVWLWKDSLGVMQRQSGMSQSGVILDSKEIFLIRLMESVDFDPIAASLNDEKSWNMICTDDPFHIPKGAKVLILDELRGAVMASPTEKQWSIVKHLVESRCSILWVTRGAQMEVDDALRSATVGMLRVIRNEEPLLKLVNLDVENASGKTTARAIDQCLHHLRHSNISEDTEFVERGGIMHVSRVFPDAFLNKMDDEIMMGQSLQDMKLHSSSRTIRMVAERVGEIDSLFYTEYASNSSALASGYVEIEVVAAGVNFKDTAAVIGLAAVQICHYLGAIVYATVGTQKKREFLKSHMGIPDNRIFSSRNISFAVEVARQTNGKGVNVILNSLEGSLLEASWRIIADNGTMVEIGKKDILDHKSLPMEPFARGAKYQAFDMGARSIEDEVKSRLLKRAFDLLATGHVKPIPRINTFSFASIPSALRLMRSGMHIGKVVISDSDDAGGADITVRARPLPPSLSLNPEKAYLIVGGLRGLCARVAIYLAKNGAKHVTIMARGGFEDEISQRAASEIRERGCGVQLVTGDVTSEGDVRRAFEANKSVPVGGVIHGAMVLRDRTFASMTLQDYRAALECKVKGAMLLHTISLDKGLDLDFFTMLSSISGVCGIKGQANYAAGSAFLDAFASYRRRLGLPACSIDLGIVEDVGYMSRHEDIAQRHEVAVFKRLDESVLQRAVGLSTIQQQRSSSTKPITEPQGRGQILTGIRLPQPDGSQLLLDTRFSGLRYVPGTEKLVEAAQLPGNENAKKDVQALMTAIQANAEPSVLIPLAAEVFGRYLARGLRLPEALDATRPLSIYGIDSLAAVEFRNFVNAGLGVELTTLDIVDAPSLNALCEKTVQRVSNQIKI